MIIHFDGRKRKETTRAEIGVDYPKGFSEIQRGTLTLFPHVKEIGNNGCRCRGRLSQGFWWDSKGNSHLVPPCEGDMEQWVSIQGSIIPSFVRFRGELSPCSSLQRRKGTTTVNMGSIISRVLVRFERNSHLFLPCEFQWGHMVLLIKRLQANLILV